VPRLAFLVYKEEGVIGFYRGLWIPLITISFVRTWKSIACLRLSRFTFDVLGAASFTIYTRTKEYFRDHQWLDQNRLADAATVGGCGGAMAGSLISFGSARK